MKHTRMHGIIRHVPALSLALLLLLLAACGANVGGTTTGSGSTPTATTTPPPTQHCGIVHTQRLQVVPADKNLAKGVEDCFWQDYQQCHPATMTYSQGNLDTVMLHTFSLKSQGSQCAITDTAQNSVLPRPPQTVGTYTCAALAQQPDGLHFTGCGSEGNVLVPSAGAI